MPRGTKQNQTSEKLSAPSSFVSGSRSKPKSRGETTVERKSVKARKLTRSKNWSASCVEGELTASLTKGSTEGPCRGRKVPAESPKHSDNCNPAVDGQRTKLRERGVARKGQGKAAKSSKVSGARDSSAHGNDTGAHGSGAHGSEEAPAMKRATEGRESSAQSALEAAAKLGKEATLKKIRAMTLKANASLFSKRVSSMVWHPTEETKMAVGSKDGGIFCWDVTSPETCHVVDPGPGAGNVLQSLFYWPADYDKLLAAGMDGTISVRDIASGSKQVLQCIPDTSKNWFVSATASKAHKLVVTGDNLGNLSLLSEQGKLQLSVRAHKVKINTMSFHPVADHLLCTASSDRTVKFWDVRALGNKSDFLAELSHEKGVNSAYFSGTHPHSLLTTDQHSQLRVYEATTGPHLYRHERTVVHPHRFFQHVTPMRAMWHPLVDVFVIGRYPDPKSEGYTAREKRSVDVIDGATGDIACQLSDSSSPGLMCLNSFSASGEYLASSMGPHVLIWHAPENWLLSSDVCEGPQEPKDDASDHEDEFTFFAL